MKRIAFFAACGTVFLLLATATFSFSLFKAMGLSRTFSTSLFESSVELSTLFESIRPSRNDTRNFAGGVFPECVEKTLDETAELQKEIEDYEKSEKFFNKITEVKGGAKISSVHSAIVDYVTSNILKPGFSVLELGAAAGVIIGRIFDAYNKIDELRKLPRGRFQGVELVDGWVAFANQHFAGNISFVKGDITEFDLGHNGTFDLIIMADVMEHVQKNRYSCLLQKLSEVTHPGSIVYMHTPTPEAQLKDARQYFENVLPHHLLVAGMASAGFELVEFIHDKTSKCHTWSRLRHVRKSPVLPKGLRGGRCYQNGWLKYYHATFVRVDQPEVLALS